MTKLLLRATTASLITAGALAAAPVAAGAATTELVSVDVAGGPANESSFVQGFSRDGRYVAFSSFASDLVAGDTNGVLNPNAGIDIFVRDRARATTERVNVSSAGRQADGASLGAALSANGRIVAFDSQATNLVLGDTNERSDIFVHDRRSRVTERISVASAGAQANSDSFADPALSRNGRFVAFSSAASNLAPGDTNGRTDVFVHDRRTGVTELVSRGSAPANSDSIAPSISADGRVVAFTSFASNLVAADTNGDADVFVRDRRTGTTRRVSVSSTGEQGNEASTAASRQALSADARLVVFQSLASNLVPGDTNGQPSPIPLGQDIFVHDRRTGATSRVNLSTAGAQANGFSQIPAISARGRFVVFDSVASNLLPGDTAFSPDLFLLDRRTGTLELVNVSSAGERGGAGGPALLSADGRQVAFATLAANLVPGDTNGHTDVFVRDRRGPR